jgi:hypothetical protein
MNDLDSSLLNDIILVIVVIISYQVHSASKERPESSRSLSSIMLHRNSLTHMPLGVFVCLRAGHGSRD